MRRIILIFLALCLVSSVKAQSPVRSHSNIEYLDWKMLKINGTVLMKNTTKLLYQLLGKPDSIVKPNMDNICVSFYNKPFKYLYLKGIQFELYGNTAIFSSIDFRRSNIKLKCDNLTFDTNTTLTSLSKIFPSAVKEQEKMLLDAEGEVMSIRLDTSKNPGDDAWILMFKNGKLIRIDYWMPC